MKKQIFNILVLAISAFVMMAFVTLQDQKIGAPWQIPANYKTKVNPHKDDNSLERLGRATFNRHCRSCHGNAGLGDGPMAKNLKTFPGDFSKAEFQKHTDGEFYYMSFVGRDEMPNFEKLIADEEERWAVVNYIRKFKK
jgi:mono/diheme cytochrome c family protein